VGLGKGFYFFLFQDIPAGTHADANGSVERKGPRAQEEVESSTQVWEWNREAAIMTGRQNVCARILYVGRYEKC
jgi:hypothetical protein